jgi:two-component system chemotaxis response regulator CheB
VRAGAYDEFPTMAIEPVVRIVAIGASAGGLPVIRRILGELPAGFPGALLVVLHMHPSMSSRLPWLLGRSTALPVRPAVADELVATGTVYVAVPDLHLLTEAGRVRLDSSAPVHWVRPSIDRLFVSVARAYGPAAAAVVLSGTGLDGADGLRAIAAAGGTTIVQEPRDAAFPGMPLAAIATGCVDHVVPLAAIAPLLVRLAGRAAAAAG